MPFEQQIQIWATVGTWIASVGTVAAVFTALWLARRTEKVRLKVHVGLRHLIGSRTEECLWVTVANLGERPVYIVSWGWIIGKRKRRKQLGMFPPTPSSPDQFPKCIEHGNTAHFMVSFSDTPDWMNEFIETIGSVPEETMESLRAEIYTSVGHVERVAPATQFLDRLKKLQS